jgi:DNA-binding SARP family transcriptional activator/Tfp pilus assembly protein PilF
MGDPAAVRACTLTILGGFALAGADGRELALPTRKDRLLLAYLALNDGRPQGRGRLAGLLWADRGETQARDSLRQSLAALRQAFRSAGIDPLNAEREAVTLGRESLGVDVWDFVTAAEQRPEQAMALYGGDLLAGCEGVSAEYDAWLAAERERLNAIAGQVLEAVSSRAAASNSATAIAFGRRLLAQDGTRESVARSLMLLLARTGQRSEALRVYSTLSDRLKVELGVGPDPETEALYRDVLTAGERPPALPAQPSATPASRPCIAVIPFRDLSSDRSLEFVCEALGEELVTGLGRYRDLLVIDRHSAASVAEACIDVAEIGRRFAADLVVQGSLQRLEHSVRITVRLMNAADRVQLWAEAFEQPLSEILNLPDRAVGSIISTLYGRLEHSLASGHRPRPDLAAYACLLRGVRHLRGYGAENNAKAIALFDEAIALDPDFHLAQLYRAFADVVVGGYASAPKNVLDAAIETGIRATAESGDDGRCHFLLALLYGFRGEIDREVECLRKALELNPNDANSMAISALQFAGDGRIDEAVERIRLAMRLNPYFPDWYWDDLGTVFYLGRRYEDAAEAFKRVHRVDLSGSPRLAASLAQCGRLEEARAVAAAILQARPDFSVAGVVFKGWSQADEDRLREGMRKAGLPG